MGDRLRLLGLLSLVVCGVALLAWAARQRPLGEPAAENLPQPLPPRMEASVAVPPVVARPLAVTVLELPLDAPITGVEMRCGDVRTRAPVAGGVARFPELPGRQSCFASLLGGTGERFQVRTGDHLRCTVGPIHCVAVSP